MTWLRKAGHFFIGKSRRRLFSSRIIGQVVFLSIPRSRVWLVEEARTEARLELLKTALALRAFRTEMGCFPEALSDLEPFGFPEAVRPPEAGLPFEYRREGNVAVLAGGLVGTGSRDMVIRLE